jgi:hypothetical protein
MTSEFDTLSTLGNFAKEKGLYKEIALYLADLAKEEIEEKLGIKYEDWNLKDVYASEGEFAIFWWLDEIHNTYDHTQLWHGLLIPVELTKAVYLIVRRQMGYKEEAIGFKRVYKIYPKIRVLFLKYKIIQEGWGLPKTRGKAHYFRENRSLCGRYSWDDTKPLQQDLPSIHELICRTCWGKLLNEGSDAGRIVPTIADFVSVLGYKTAYEALEAMVKEKALWRREWIPKKIEEVME